MKSLKNQVRLVGYIGKDPESNTFDSGKNNAKFSLATTENFKNKEGEKVSETQWHNITAWGATAKFATDYVKKGDEIILEGALKYRDYENDKGEKKYFTEIIANELLLISKKENRG